MSKGNGEVVSVTILPNSSGTPQGKLADAEVIFGVAAGILAKQGPNLAMRPFLTPEHRARWWEGGTEMWVPLVPCKIWPVFAILAPKNHGSPRRRARGA